MNLKGMFRLPGNYISLVYLPAYSTTIFYTSLLLNFQLLLSHPHLQLITVNYFTEKNRNKEHFDRVTTINTHLPVFDNHTLHLPLSQLSMLLSKASPPICVPDSISSCYLKDTITQYSNTPI